VTTYRPNTFDIETRSLTTDIGATNRKSNWSCHQFHTFFYPPVTVSKMVRGLIFTEKN